MILPVARAAEVACMRKVRHRTQDDARVALAEAEADGAHMERLGIYLCPRCRGWHLGHATMGKKAYR